MLGRNCRRMILAAIVIAGGLQMAQAGQTVDATLNGLQIEFDSASGGIVHMSYPGPGTLLEAEPGDASLIDVAHPVPEFDPLRLASRFSTGARIDVAPGCVTVVWPRLGASREKWNTSDGAVSATVRLRAMPDGRSILMTCEVDNQSSRPVRQVLFPDFRGLLPIGGEDNTNLRSCGFNSTPFRDLKPIEARKREFYATDTGGFAAEYKSGGIFNPMWVRWLDFGSLRGGFSIFPRQWGWDPATVVRLHHSETTNTLRLMHVNDALIEPGQTWHSCEYVLTPHAAGWAKGIEVYRDWVRAHMQRKHEMPRRIREALGFRTIWMTEGWPDDPKDANFTFADLPALARETHEHGLAEMVMWSWCRGFRLPLPAPMAHLGTAQDMATAAEQCKREGAELVPFVSVIQGDKDTAARYGLTASASSGWTQHSETVPRLNPPYSSLYACAQIGPTNPKWEDEVLTSIQHLLDLGGVTSISWDQFWTENKDKNMLAFATTIRSLLHSKDPEASFSGEELWGMEFDCELLDYTWNWQDCNCQAFISAFPAPRINCNIDSDPAATKRAFMDNKFLAAFPRKPGKSNGSDWIRNHPELSAALKQCAALRKQFLPYFTDGYLIGECVLDQPCPDAYVSAYVLPDRLLVFALNQSPRRTVQLDTNLRAWLPSQDHKWTLRRYSADGRTQEDRQISQSLQRLSVPRLGANEIAVFEVIAAAR